MNEPQPAPLLSVLIPAYSYPDGVERILRMLSAPGLGHQIELRIADDSPDDGVESLVQSLAPSFEPTIAYRRNRPALGAAANWNSLLDEARGHHVWLLHHDEFPLGEAFLPRLLQELRSDEETDTLLMDCLLVEPTRGRNRQHLPMALRSVVVRHAPGYLFRRNVIGPASCLVVRRERYPRFDTRLRWLVDVDAFARLLSGGIRARVCTALKVGSVQGRPDSITKQIAQGLAPLHREELDLLLAKHAGTPLEAWLALAGGQSPGARAFRGVETLAWAGLRVATHVLAGLGVGAVPPALARQALLGSR